MPIVDKSRKGRHVTFEDEEVETDPLRRQEMDYNERVMRESAQSQGMPEHREGEISEMLKARQGKIKSSSPSKTIQQGKRPTQAQKSIIETQHDKRGYSTNMFQLK